MIKLVRRSMCRAQLMLWMILASVPITYAQSLTGDSWAEASAAKSGTVTVTYVETPGLVYKTSDGQLTGVCVDILKDFGAWLQEEKGVSLSLNFVGSGTSFGEMYASVKDGSNGVIGLGNITIRESRKKEVSFSPAFMNSFAILASHKSVPELSAIDKISTEFAGMKAYAAEGTTNEQRIQDLKQQHFADLVITSVSSSPEAMQKVLEDTRSFSYLDITFYLDAVKNGQQLRRHAVGDNGSEEFGLIMPLGSDWAPLMAEFFSAKTYRSSNQYQRILHDHLGPAAVKLLKTSN